MEYEIIIPCNKSLTRTSLNGANTPMPFSVHHNVDHPLSLYAATKKANLDDLVEQFDYQSSIPVEKRPASFSEWFEYYHKHASLN